MLELLATVGETRRLLAEQAHSSLSWVFLVVLEAWLTLLFFGFGLFARFNRTVVIALFAGVLSVAAAVFVILEMTHPYSGSMRVSSAPLRDALNQMNEQSQHAVHDTFLVALLPGLLVRDLGMLATMTALPRSAIGGILALGVFWGIVRPDRA